MRRTAPALALLTLILTGCGGGRSSPPAHTPARTSWDRGPAGSATGPDRVVPGRARRDPLLAPRPGRIPALLERRDVYAADRPGRLAPRRPARPRARLRAQLASRTPSTSSTSARRRIVEHFAVGALPQHVTPSWDLRTLWVTNDRGNSLTPIDPRTGRHGPPRARCSTPTTSTSPPTGAARSSSPRRHRELDFREPHTMRLRHALHVPRCAGVDHMDFTADGRHALVSCEFAGRMIVVDLRRERVVRTIALRAGAMPQDVKLSPDGRTFYVADMASDGVWLIDARRMRTRAPPADRPRRARPVPEPRLARCLYVSNRGEGTITRDLVPHPAADRASGDCPAAAHPTWAALSADGRVLWLSGRYNAEVYAISHAHRPPAAPHHASGRARTASASGRSPAATRSATPASCASRQPVLSPPARSDRGGERRPLLAHEAAQIAGRHGKPASARRTPRRAR